MTCPLAPRHNHAPEIRRALTDVRGLCDALGLTAAGGKSVLKQSRGLIVRCVWHQENSPSMSVRLAADGTIACKCFGCDASGDALDLIATARGMSMSGAGFREVLIAAAELAGLWGTVAELEGRAPRAPSIRPTPPPQPPPEPPRDYPPAPEVQALWDACIPTADAPQAAAYLLGRNIQPDQVDVRDLARALPLAGPLPPWALCRGGDWRAARYLVVVPMFSAMGEIRSLRGWRVGGDESLPKRIPPVGHKASGLVMADEWARAMLAGTRFPARIVVTEGEPDFLTWATRLTGASSAAIGIVSGSWTRALAGRFPVGARVDVRTDHDAAGDRYAAEVVEGLKRRCFAYRSKRSP